MATLIKPFDQLSTSTATTMVYTNINFRREFIFSTIEVTQIIAKLSKKKRAVDKKKLQAPYGAIISVQYGLLVNGIRMSKNKKYYCKVCQPDKLSKTFQGVNTINECLQRVPEKECIEKGYPLSTFRIHFICSLCKKEYPVTKLKKIPNFLNQITVVLSIGHRNINVMIFKDSIKLAGCQTLEDATIAMMILWEEYIGPDPKSWSLVNLQNKQIKFLFEIVMRNVDFKIDFPIDKKKLNQLMNREEFSNRVFMSQWESTSATHVNIKMRAKKPEDFKYQVLVYNIDDPLNDKFIIFEKENEFQKKSNKEKFNTMIVFASSEVILSSRYATHYSEDYTFFVNTVDKHRKEIEEVINPPQLNIKEYLSTLNLSI